MDCFCTVGIDPWVNLMMSLDKVDWVNKVALMHGSVSFIGSLSLAMMMALEISTSMPTWVGLSKLTVIGFLQNVLAIFWTLNLYVCSCYYKIVFQINVFGFCYCVMLLFIHYPKKDLFSTNLFANILAVGICAIFSVTKFSGSKFCYFI